MSTKPETAAAKAAALLDRLRALAQAHDEIVPAQIDRPVLLALVEALERHVCRDVACAGCREPLAAAYDALEPEGGA